MNKLNNPENPSAVPAFRSPFRAVSTTDYRGQMLPSIFGPEIAHFAEQRFAREWLEGRKFGGTVERWNPIAEKYEAIETVKETK